MFFSAKHYYRLMHDVDKDKFQFRFGKQTTVDFLDLYNGCHINTCQTPTPLNWYNYHLCLFQWSIELKCAFHEKSSHVEMNLSNQFCPQLSRDFKWNNLCTLNSKHWSKHEKRLHLTSNIISIGFDSYPLVIFKHIFIEISKYGIIQTYEWFHN